VLVDIWFLHWRSPFGDLLPACFIIFSLIRHKETLESLGLRLEQSWPALYAWRFALLPCAAAVLVGCFVSGRPWYLLFRGSMYFIWCVLQQVLLNNLIYRRLRDDVGPTWGTCAVAGALFAVAHVPNPVLVPATLAWGTVATRLFERRRSVIALGLLQTLLSALLLWMTPLDVNQQFRVGPGYWHRHAMH
jgi:hypothetical protein